MNAESFRVTRLDSRRAIGGIGKSVFRLAHDLGSVEALAFQSDDPVMPLAEKFRIERAADRVVVAAELAANGTP